MTMLQNRIDVQAEINACECIRAFDETRLDLELQQGGARSRWAFRFASSGSWGEAAPHRGSDEATCRPACAGAGSRNALRSRLRLARNSSRQRPALDAVYAGAGLFELAGILKFFDATKGYGFIVADGEHGATSWCT